jgi:hypothetical protein
MKRRVYSNTTRARAARTIVLLSLSGMPITAALAQADDAETLADLKACAALERSNARLACYDGVLGRPTSALEIEATAAATPPAAPPPAAPVAPAPEAAYPRTIVVVELRLRTPSSAIFVTDTGEVWAQTGSGRGRYPDVPFEATLERGSLGSTFLVSPIGGPGIRVALRD